MEKFFNEKRANELKAALILCGVHTDRELADKLNVKASTIHKRFAGVSEWKVTEVRSLASIIGLTNVNAIFFN